MDLPVHFKRHSKADEGGSARKCRGLDLVYRMIEDLVRGYFQMLKIALDQPVVAVGQSLQK